MQTITLPPPKRSWFSLISWAVLLAVLVISWKGAEMDPLLLFRDSGNMATFAADFFLGMSGFTNTLHLCE